LLWKKRERRETYQITSKIHDDKNNIGLYNMDNMDIDNFDWTNTLKELRNDKQQKLKKIKKLFELINKKVKISLRTKSY